MSSSTAIPASPELTAEWTKATTDAKPYRYMQVKIQKENLNLVAKSAGTASVSKDFDELQSKVSDGESCYFLFRIAGPKNWVLISYVPEGTAKVNEKMVYAATKNTLKNKLGPQFINEEVHFTAPSELTYSFYVKSKEPVNSFSEFEKMRQQIHQAEEEERVYRSDRTTDVGSSDKIGGYHHVTIPLAANAKDEIERAKTGVINFVEFRINTSSNVVETVSARSVGAAELAAAVKGSEPRFYLYAYQKIRSPGHPKANTLIYFCPDSSPANLRMVYATSKPTVVQQIIKLGFQIGKTLEIRDGADLTEEYLKTELFSARTVVKYTAPDRTPPQFNRPSPSPLKKPSPSSKPAGLSSTSTSRTASRIVTNHPVYSLMGGGGANVDQKKTVIMPPPGAW